MIVLLAKNPFFIL